MWPCCFAARLQVHITEMDVRCSNCTDAKREVQARVYASMLAACLSVPACRSFETWGFTDRYTWLGSDTEPLPFDTNYQPKLAVQQVKYAYQFEPPLDTIHPTTPLQA